MISSFITDRTSRISILESQKPRPSTREAVQNGQWWAGVGWHPVLGFRPGSIHKSFQKSLFDKSRCLTEVVGGGVQASTC